MNTSKQTILVTGAAGYLASWVVEQLLRAGHTVHGTVRSLKDARKVAHLLKLAQQLPGTLHLFEADLLTEQGFDRAMQHCDTVIHTASPYFLKKSKDPEAQLVRPALQGTRNVLNSVNRTESVKRVVLTSSVVALYNDAKDVGANVAHTVQEDDINPNTDIHHNSYAYSKTVAEQAAWQMQKAQSRWDMVTIHPGAIYGPSLSARAEATSVDMVIQFLKGSFRTGVPRLWLGVVDVRDVALAHVKAALLPAASKRYIVVGQNARLLEMAAVMRVDEHGIKNKLPTGEAPKALMWLIGPLVGLQRSFVARNVGHPLFFNNSRSKSELGIDYRSLDVTFNDHIEQIVRDGLLAAPPQKGRPDEKLA
ncbi:MAG: NAD-dependent epimerase/dehydratase family protein [Pseudomonadota bacterium]